MKFKIINKKEFNLNINYQKSICCGIFKNKKLDIEILKKNNYVNNIVNKEFLYEKLYKNIILYNISDTNINKLVIIECGKEMDFNDYEYKLLIKKYITIIKEINEQDNTCFLTLIPVKNKSNEWKIRIAIKIIREELYLFENFKKNNNSYVIKKINFVMDEEILENIVYESQIISDAVDITKNLGNLPSNICNSNYLLEKSIELSKNSNNITYELVNKEDMKLLGMNSYLSVSLGSKNDPVMAILKYKGSKNSNKNIILIGKGITFDTGGVSLKSSQNMDEMKFDMCGSASIYGVMYAIDKLNLPINVIAILAICENSIDGKSSKPGDIVYTLSGKTVEILNTDAEGRLILCDAITYSYKFNPYIIIDVATLTGACVIALGSYFSGLMSNDDNLSKEIISASNEIDDKAWRLPLIRENQKQIESNIADIKNIGDGKAGTITAGYFLYNFIKNNTKWAHLDIAGTSYDKEKKSTGRPVYLLTKFLINKSKTLI